MTKEEKAQLSKEEIMKLWMLPPMKPKFFPDPQESARGILIQIMGTYIDVLIYGDRDDAKWLATLLMGAFEEVGDVDEVIFSLGMTRDQCYNLGRRHIGFARMYERMMREKQATKHGKKTTKNVRNL